MGKINISVMSEPCVGCTSVSGLERVSAVGALRSGVIARSSGDTVRSFVAPWPHSEPSDLQLECSLRPLQEMLVVNASCQKISSSLEQRR